MKVAYLRISTDSQKLDRQTDLMAELGVDKVFVDIMSGKSADRPQLKEMLDFLREGDELIVESISRLARNTKDLLELTEKLTAKGVKFIRK
jgi:DNA invertase Pin-like site-specific DNA recombinase